MKLVKHYMKKKVIKVSPTDSIFKVIKLLSKHHIAGVPVVKNKRVMGIITETDLIKFIKMDVQKTHSEFMTEPHSMSIVMMALIKNHLSTKRRLSNLSRVKVNDFMSENVISINSNESIIEAANVFDQNHIDRLPVIDDGKLVGIITRTDLIRALLD